MRTQKILLIGLAAFVALSAGAAAAKSDYWIHVRVDEGHNGAKVSVNLPVALFERALPLVPEVAYREARIELDRTDLELEDLRAMWQELRDSPDMTLVKVEEHDSTVRVWKEKGFFRVSVDEEWGDKVDIRLPASVVDALLASEQINVKAAVEALIAAGGGELVTINEDRDGDRVRIWIDRTPEAD